MFVRRLFAATGVASVSVALCATVSVAGDGASIADRLSADATGGGVTVTAGPTGTSLDGSVSGSQAHGVAGAHGGTDSASTTSSLSLSGPALSPTLDLQSLLNGLPGAATLNGAPGTALSALAGAGTLVPGGLPTPDPFASPPGPQDIPALLSGVYPPRPIDVPPPVVTNLSQVVTGTTSQVTGLATTATSPNGTWTRTGLMAAQRMWGTLTELTDGRVLAAGGIGTDYEASAELFDPHSGTWSLTGSMSTPRFRHTATLLKDGRVLVIGGADNGGILSSADIYDPATGTWSAAGNMASPRDDHEATLLLDGRVLVTGGGAPPELFDPATLSFKLAAPMTFDRNGWGETATLLPDGTVLVAGGATTWGPSSATQIYDPVHDVWSSGPAMSVARYGHTATLITPPLPLLGPAEVVVTGGQDQSGHSLAATEVYDIAHRQWRRVGDLHVPRVGDAAAALSDGRLLVTGGEPGDGTTTTTAEIFSPLNDQWSLATSMNLPRFTHCAALLADGRVLVAAGNQMVAEVLSLPY